MEPERRRVYCAYQKQGYMSKKMRAFGDLVVKSIADIDNFNVQIASVLNGRKSSGT
jgi:hypothetical protein